MKRIKKQKAETNGPKYFRDLFNRKIYEVPTTRLREYGFYSNRYTISIMLGILLNNFKIGNEVIIFISLGLMALMEFRYRRSFLPSLNVRNHINVDKTVSKEAMIMNAVLYLVVGVLFFIYGLTGEVGESIKWILMALGVGSVGLTFMYLNEILAIK